MKATLLKHTADAEKLAGVAAFTSCSPEGSDELMKTKTKDECDKFLKRVLNYGHHSVIEHASFTFSVEGISRACTHQIVRHRIASYTQQSQRYVKFKELGFVMPPSIEKNEEVKKTYLEAMKNASNAYDKLIECGIAPEDARYVYPNASHTNIMITMNARELWHFFSLRCCTRAQWELREIAEKMLAEVKKVAPLLFKDAGASCVRLGYCPEGSLGCGRYPTLKQLKEKEAIKC
ncbi:MAG: FAD-dependent thymidylate synthase [Candidatus Aenigmarchaeota archaeon]|nr:FAD-dependent thymidylate synthase [Candidatus Aenigmarchaeota archaeon]